MNPTTRWLFGYDEDTAELLVVPRGEHPAQHHPTDPDLAPPAPPTPGYRPRHARRRRLLPRRTR